MDVVRLLTHHGLRLPKAHGILNRLSPGAVVPVELPSVSDPDALIAKLADLGIAARRPADPAPVDIAALRQQQGLTQKEFALRYGIELGSLRNWEQGRAPQDTETRILMHVIARHPEVVDEVISGQA